MGAASIYAFEKRPPTAWQLGRDSCPCAYCHYGAHLGDCRLANVDVVYSVGSGPHSSPTIESKGWVSAGLNDHRAGADRMGSGFSVFGYELYGKGRRHKNSVIFQGKSRNSVGFRTPRQSPA